MKVDPADLRRGLLHAYGERLCALVTCALAACALAASGCARDANSRDTNEVVAGDVRVRNILAPAPIVTSSAADVTMAVYFTVENTGDTPDTLASVTTPDASMAMLHQTTGERGMGGMTMLPALPIPAGQSVRLEPGAVHVMLEGLRALPHAGDSLALTLRFRRAGDVHAVARVVTYDSLQALRDAAARQR